MALSRQYFSNAIANGLKILRLFDTDRTKLSLNEISQELGLNKASVFRFVNTLIELGYLIKEPRTKEDFPFFSSRSKCSMKTACSSMGSNRNFS
jgi:predicted transcriptional regulator